MNRLTVEQVVPTLRGPLIVKAPGGGIGAELISVGPVDSPQSMQLHGFEFSIARMLDGRRTAQEVMRSCSLLGIPLSLSALEGFLAELDLHGLLSHPAQPLSPSSASARRRRAWDAAVRDTYRSALRSAREGEPEHARKLVVKLLEVDPGNAEAMRLLGWVEHQRERAVAPAERRDFLSLYHRVEREWRTHLPPDPTPARLGWQKLRDVSWLAPRLVVPLAAGLLVAALLVPLPRVIPADVQLYPASVLHALAERDGLVRSVSVREGDRVEPGAPLFTWNTEASRAELERLEQLAAEARGSPVSLASMRVSASAPPPAPWDTSLDERIEQLRAQISTRRVVAPSAGIVHDLRVGAGVFVQRGQPLYELSDVDSVKMVAVIQPRQARLIRAGDPLTVRVGDSRFLTRVEAVTAFEVIAPLQGGPTGLEPGSRTLTLEFEPASLWRRLW